MPRSAEDYLREGTRAVKLGVPDRALECFQRVQEVTTSPELCAEALTREADVHRTQCAWDAALDCARQAQGIAEAAKLPRHLDEAINAEGSVLIARGDLAAAVPLFEQLAAGTADLRMRGIALQNLGTVHAQQGRLDAAETAFAESYYSFVACGYERGQAIALNNRGRLALDRRDIGRAAEVLDSALEVARTVGDEELIALATANLAEATLYLGDPDAAWGLVCVALGSFRSSGNVAREIECLRMLGAIDERRQDFAAARRCYRHALSRAREVGAKLEVEVLEQAMERLGALTPPSLPASGAIDEATPPAG